MANMFLVGGVGNTTAGHVDDEEDFDFVPDCDLVREE
jgi:hypothetical protein